MGKMSKEKGKRGELEVAALIRGYGFEAERGQQHSGSPDSPDVRHSIPGLHVEVKRTEKLSLYDALAQAEADAEGSTVAQFLPPKVPTVFHRRNGQPWVVILDAHHFMAMIYALDHLRKKEENADQD